MSDTKNQANDDPASDQEEQPLQKPTFLQMIGSVLSAIFGVQSSKNRERDFTQGSYKDFIAVYVVIVVLIVLAMIGLVKTVLHFAAVG